MTAIAATDRIAESRTPVSSAVGAPSLAVRLGIALAFSLLAGVFAYWYVLTKAGPVVAYDFTWGWRAARALVGHQNPYVVIQPTGGFPFDAPFKYPLTYAILSLPFAPFAPAVAMATFGAVGAGVFAFALTRDGYWRLPLLASAPVVTTLMVGQSSMYVAAGYFVPAVAFLGCCMKPTSALLVLAARPRSIRIAAIGTILLGAIGLALNPWWVFEWIHAMRTDPTAHLYYPAANILPFGPLLFLAALRWKTPEGRLLLAAAIVPQHPPFYTGLYPLLVARTYRECLVLAVLSHVGFLGWFWFDHAPNSEYHQAPWVMVFIYLPALAMTLRRPNIAS